MKKILIIFCFVYSVLFVGVAFAMAGGVDGGIEAVDKAQEEPFSPEVVETATEQLKDWMASKGFNEGWDEKKKRYFVIGSKQLNAEDPSYDDSFITKREIAAKISILEAKAEIISYVNTEMSASDQLTTPGTDLHEKFGAELEKQNKKLEKQKELVAKLLEQSDAAEAEELRGVTTRDRLNSLMEAAIKKLDGDFDAGKIEAEKRQKYEKAKGRYLEASKKLDEVEEEANALKGQITETFESTVEAHAKMPLFGATVIAQTESWDDNEEKYEVAVLLCWSSKLEKAARAVLSGQNPQVKPKKNKKSIHEWLKTQDLSVMVGPRQYIDAQGQRHFLAVSARPVVKSASRTKNNQKKAKLFAKQMAVFSLFGDVESYEKASQMMQSRSAGANAADQTTAVESLETNMSQTFEKMTIKGLGKLTDAIVVHPISNQKIYVVVYGVSPANAASAFGIQKSSYATAIQVDAGQKEMKGVKAGMEQELQRAKVDNTAYEQGKDKGSSEVRNEVDSRNGKNPGRASKSASNAGQSSKASSGSYMGDTDVDDDF